MPISVADANSLLNAELRATAYTGPASLFLGLSTAGQVTDGATTASSTTVTSASAQFGAGDVGKTIVGGSIPGGATISSVTNATTVVISAAATATASGVTLTIGGAEVSGGSYARQAPGFSAAASGSSPNAAAINFTAMPATTVRQIILYDAATAGTDHWDGYITPVAVASGNTFQFAASALTATIS